KMYKQSFLKYEEANQLRKSTESLIAMRKVCEGIIQVEYDLQIRTAIASNDFERAFSRFGEMEQFIREHSKLELKEPLGLRDWMNQMLVQAIELWYKEAEDLVLKGDFETASTLLRKIRSYAPQKKEAIYLENLCRILPAYEMGKLAQEQGRLKDALAQYDFILGLDPVFKDVVERRKRVVENGRVSIAYVQIDAPKVDVKLEKDFSVLMCQELLKMDNAFFQLIDRDNTEKIISEQKLAMSGLMDEDHVIEAGKLVGAKYILLSEVMDEFNDQKHYDAGEGRGFIGKTKDARKVRYSNWSENYSCKLRMKFALLNAETGELIQTFVLEDNENEVLNWSTCNGDCSKIYPGYWRWELLDSDQDKIDIAGFSDLQLKFNSKPDGNKLKSLVLKNASDVGDKLMREIKGVIEAKLVP
ncbi:MAG: CsgG/HfaB family protein, partial [Bacteroidota bacterium]